MIIGTAGHIDHGKTALIRRLTGIDTDRLPEEKRRGMTIDLGFAHLDLEGVGRVGIVDVPGHERFVHNMVAGAGGFDLVLLVVAADDGVMPQTREHLDIVSLLGIESCVVALNKTDLVPADRIQTVTDEIRALAQTAPCLREAPIVPVSAHTGEGLEALRGVLAEKLKKIRPHDNNGYFRMAIDRAFAMPGFGPVVTGTIASGRVHKDDSLRLLPGGQIVRVRGLQQHGQTAESVAAGNRCAVNLAGIEIEALARGMMICDPRLERIAHTVDVSLRLAHGLKQTPRDRQRLRFHSGTAEEFARLVWIGDAPEDGTGLAQLRLERGVPLMYGDRFILRNESAEQTLGGGAVLDAFASRRAVARPERRTRLQCLLTGNAEEALQAWLEAPGADGWRLAELAEQLAQAPEQLRERLARRTDLIREDFGDDAWIAPSAAVDNLLERLHSAVADYLRAHPRSTAMPPATLHEQTCPRLEARVFRALIARLLATGRLEQVPDGLCVAGHRQQFSAAETLLADRIESTLQFRGKPPPKLEALARAVGQPAPRLARFLGELERAGRVVKLAPDLYITRRDAEAWRNRLDELLAQQGEVTLPQFRDAIGAGREFTMQLLDYFDRVGVTRRQGDVRIAAQERRA
ncbi:MAG: selenocysteine-specific translation elongation factor [Candidatus Muproteobacteria bacterium RIFCSPHIGHO2_12_FULL_60_33]|uniref:Selenocysteine-specific elongation factor n=1 Tax=Candidatus Muproteobacteria bacterium RIFCSPLOWO2_01_FULL_60_18 TaxID=1817768 RepID=A0A1F6TZ87_9PROT|nr:MAG: selenocysteine-specific translation elongation factor [Candidatus Muproteobacteria bacterium RIFCSPLOWO2_01_FULL_60_18]OGI54219.1 MAG: selenocysteine-specific translation elongation factor [Candidatus Muproteobacteria bacterium RIFCSPHIGHO2_12_FULL_60_33]OGI59175.1 MAG: selenocysteine-specific translation elongation factor [Candidatus Muproteobacteria bacterium RIFCSPHIGHO2_01_FULL_61_200]